MLIIHVRHFLNDKGLAEFDQWFALCQAYLSKQDGFHSLYRAFDNTQPGLVHVWLHYESREKMLVWGESLEHAELIGRLDPYRIQDWEATWYDTESPDVQTYVIPLGKHSVL